MNRIIGLFLASIIIASFMIACAPSTEGNDPGKDVDIKVIHEKIKEEFGEDYIPDSQMDEDILQTVTGVDPANVEEFIAENPMISVNIDTFIAIKAKDGKGDEVEKSLQKYRTEIVENAMMYPMNQAKANAVKVVRHGDFVFLLMLGKYDDREDATEEEALEFARNEVKRAEDIIDGFFK